LALAALWEEGNPCAVVGVAARGDSRLSNYSLQSPTQRPLLSLQEGQRRKMLQIKESGNPLRLFWVLVRWCFVWVFSPPKSSIYRNVVLLNNPSTFFTTLNVARTFS